MKLTTTTQVSVDGVMQAPGGPDENGKGGFERGGWAHFDNEAATFVTCLPGSWAGFLTLRNREGIQKYSLRFVGASTSPGFTAIRRESCPLANPTSKSSRARTATCW